MGVATLATQCRIASLTASLSVCEPLSTGSHLGAEQLHPEHVERLSLDVDGAHVDHALHADQGRGRCGGNAVLAGAGLGDEPRLAHPLGEQRLAEHVVDLVRAGVVEVLALEEQPTPELLAEVVTLGQRAMAGRRSRSAACEFGPELRVRPRLAERGLQLLAGGHQCLGNEATTELAEAAGASGGPVSSESGSTWRPSMWVHRGCVHSLRRPSRRGVRRRRGTASSRGAGILDESLDRRAVLLARGLLDSGRHVDAPRLHLGDRASATFSGVEASGEDQFQRVRGFTGERPVEHLAGAGARERRARSCRCRTGRRAAGWGRRSRTP